MLDSSQDEHLKSLVAKYVRSVQLLYIYSELLDLLAGSRFNTFFEISTYYLGLKGQTEYQEAEFAEKMMKEIILLGTLKYLLILDFAIRYRSDQARSLSMSLNSFIIMFREFSYFKKDVNYLTFLCRALRYLESNFPSQIYGFRMDINNLIKSAEGWVSLDQSSTSFRKSQLPFESASVVKLLAPVKAHKYSLETEDPNSLDAEIVRRMNVINKCQQILEADKSIIAYHKPIVEASSNLQEFPIIAQLVERDMEPTVNLFFEGVNNDQVLASSSLN